MNHRGLMGRIVRLYQPNDYFWQGKVCAVDVETSSADVDYGDWIQRYDARTLRLTFMADGTYQDVLIPCSEGECIADFRDHAA